jgi:hypothetical protein
MEAMMSTVRMIEVIGEIPQEGYRWETDEEVYKRLSDVKSASLTEVKRKLVKLHLNEICCIHDRFGILTLLTSKWYKDNV